MHLKDIAYKIWLEGKSLIPRHIGDVCLKMKSRRYRVGRPTLN